MRNPQHKGFRGRFVGRIFARQVQSVINRHIDEGFLDTNVFLEYFERRPFHQSVGVLFDAIEEGKIKAVVSTGCVYTLAYLIRVGFKRQGIYRPEQTERLRETLATVLSLATVANISHRRMVDGINDTAFDDVEDSFQYQCALQAKCDILVTINLKDYKNAYTSTMEILSPVDMAKRIMTLQ